jgi:tryptophan halogenase
MSDRHLRSIAIIGGGSAGWMTAAALANAVGKNCEIHLVESEEIGTIGVGEATIPPIKFFNQRLGIDEATFVRETQGSFKLGIEFVNWGQKGDAYFHPFGQYGAEFDYVPLYHYWMLARDQGDNTRIDEYSMCWAAARAGKFAHPIPDKRRIQSTYDYAYHFDATLYAKFLRGYAEARGVTRHEGKVTDAQLNSETGYIEKVMLEDGREVAADLFVDCTGFFGLLIEKYLKTGYDNWQHWLPCDRAVALPSEKNGDPIPYTRATAHEAGWQWRIPLQHRTGNGHVYCSQYIDEDRATETLLQNLDAEPVAEPRHLRFVTGKRKKFWNKNCIAIGLSAGFMEPLESTSLHLIQYGIMRMIAMLPDRDMSPLLAEEYNRLTAEEYEGIRDFLILHYKATTRDDTPFWQYCRDMSVPDSLQYKMDHFQTHGLFIAKGNELFSNASWLAVYTGQNIYPKKAPALAGMRPGIPYGDRLQSIRKAMAEAVDEMPTHQQFIDRHCKAAAQ